MNDGYQIEAIREFFPSATGIIEMQPDQDSSLASCPGNRRVSWIKDRSDILGFIVEAQVTSRSGPFEIRVILDHRLKVKQAVVTSYRHSRGRAVCSPSFTRQFRGKGPADPIELGKDIDAITGATLSSRAMAETVRIIIEQFRLVQKR